MGVLTGIAWTDHTFNPWWGCNEVSPACDNCYARVLAERFGYGTTRPRIWGTPNTTTRRTFGPRHWDEPLEWNRKAEAAGKRERVFCASMADVFEYHPDLTVERARLWALIERTPWLDWQLLTKRPEQVVRMLPSDWRAELPPNVWIGVTAEDQERLELRGARLLAIKARTRFLSIEPLLSYDMEIGPWLEQGISWVIIGGESGHGQPERKLVERCDCSDVRFWVCGCDRISHGTIIDKHCTCHGSGWRPKTEALAAVLRLVDECRQAGAAVFFKQWGGPFDHAAGRVVHGTEYLEFPSTALATAQRVEVRA